MTHYLIALHDTGDDAPASSMGAEEIRSYMERIETLHGEMKTAGAWVFSGALQGPDASSVVRVEDGDVMTIDGPFVETKEQLAGFYVIEADDRAGALAWAAKAAQVVGRPLEVRPFRESEA